MAVESWSKISVPQPGVEPETTELPWLLSLLEKNFNREIENNKVGRMFIKRWICVNRHMGRLSKRERAMHFNPSLGWVKSLIRWQFFHVFVFLWPIILLCSLTQGPLLCVHASFSQDGFQCKGPWEVSKTYYGLVFSPFRYPRKLSDVCSQGLLDSKNETMSPIDLLRKQALVPLHPCYYCYLNVYPREKVQLFTPFLLLLLSWSINKTLVVNI